ncbi:MAG TPA: OmpA family protein [Rhizomicrobium sp.]|jgi:outer membrane protein OmpA-like peptidoglycan-associated protein
MQVSLGGLARKLMQLGAVVAIAATLGACSVIPDWMGGDSDSSDTAALPSDQSAAPADTTANNGQFPDLADTPDRPAAPSTADDQKKVADSLAADRARQNYSADALRAGTEPAAAPPSATPPADDVAEVDTGSKSSPSSDSDSESAPSSDSSSSSAASSTAPAATTAAAPASAPAPAPTAVVASSPAPAPSGGLPAVPASTVNGAQSVSMSDAALGFQPSKAPPLDASVAQFVPMPIMARYQQTASMSGAAGLSGAPSIGSGGPAVPAAPASRSTRAMGGPEQMSGAVVANFDALQGGAVAPSAAYSNAQGLPPAAVVMFPPAATILGAEAKAQVQSAAQAYNARGGTGYIRVVGHAAIASTKVSEARRLQINFERSQARATAVMRELIKDGVPANKILVDAVGDSQPVYDASTQGEGGNRRAEIFFQG